MQKKDKWIQKHEVKFHRPTHAMHQKIQTGPCCRNPGKPNEYLRIECNPGARYQAQATVARGLGRD